MEWSRTLGRWMRALGWLEMGSGWIDDAHDDDESPGEDGCGSWGAWMRALGGAEESLRCMDERPGWGEGEPWVDG